MTSGKAAMSDGSARKGTGSEGELVEGVGVGVLTAVLLARRSFSTIEDKVVEVGVATIDFPAESTVIKEVVKTVTTSSMSEFLEDKAWGDGLGCEMKSELIIEVGVTDGVVVVVVVVIFAVELTASICTAEDSPCTPPPPALVFFSATFSQFHPPPPPLIHELESPSSPPSPHSAVPEARKRSLPERPKSKSCSARLVGAA